MRCPKCNLELNPLSERCPNCGTSAKLAKPDGDTMTRVRRQIAIVRRETEVSDEDLSDTSFSPVLKFDRPSVQPEDPPIAQNPADNFEDYDFTPVDLTDMADGESDEEKRHQSLARSIRRIERNKEDDLLAAYYFKDGISDLEQYRLLQSYAALERDAAAADSSDAKGTPQAEQSEEPPVEEMSEAARRLNTFPEESGLDKVLTSIGEKYDAVVIKGKAFFDRLINKRCRRLYQAFDRKTAPFLNRVLERIYHKRWEKLRRKREDSEAEKRLMRRRIWSVCVVLLLLSFCGVIFIASLFSEPINGQWVVSYDAGGKPNIIMEFTPGGSAVISIKSEDGWHVHRQGRYKTQRKNGHDMLTITYEDGSVSRLYYEIDGRTGTFTNVDTNVRVEYQQK